MLVLWLIWGIGRKKAITFVYCSLAHKTIMAEISKWQFNHSKWPGKANKMPQHSSSSKGFFFKLYSRYYPSEQYWSDSKFVFLQFPSCVRHIAGAQHYFVKIFVLESVQDSCSKQPRHRLWTVVHSWLPPTCKHN